MTNYWIDYSAGKLSASTIKAWTNPAGDRITGVIRYIDSPANLSTKHTNPVEYQDHVRNGLHVRLVMQVNTTDADGGYARGQAYAQRALAGANYIGYPGKIYFTNDRTTLANPSVWQAYLDGAASVLGKDRVGAYGFRNAQDAAVGHATGFWQSGRRSELAPHANMWQDNNTQITVGGITCDRNLIITEDEVAITDADAALIATKIFWGTPFEQTTNYAGYLKGSITNLNAQLVQANTAIAGLSQAIARLSNDPDITVEQMTSIVNAAIAENIHITGTVEITSDPTP